MDELDRLLGLFVSKDIEYDDKFWDDLELILKDAKLKKMFVSKFIIISNDFNEKNIMSVIGLITDVVKTLEINLPELYDNILSLMYKKFSYNYSLSYKFADLLINIKDNNKELVFKDIIKSMDINDVLSIRISICSLYGNFEFNEITNDLVKDYLDKIFNTLKKNLNDKLLKKDIENFLLDNIKRSDYISYLKKYNDLVSC